jgi:hypothetical protein
MSMPRALPVLLLLLLALTACDQKTQPTTPAVTGKPVLDTSGAKKISTRVPQGQTFKGLVMSHSLPYAVQLGKHDGLVLEGEGSTNIIRDGEATMGLDARGQFDKNLRIQNFDTTSDTAMVQVDVGQGSDTSLLGADTSDGSAPVLIDSKNDRYFPVGYFYEDESKIKVRFTPGDVIQELSRVPTLSRSRPAQKLTLLYRVNSGRSVKYFAVSNKALVEFDPPVAVSQSNR